MDMVIICISTRQLNSVFLFDVKWWHTSQAFPTLASFNSVRIAIPEHSVGIPWTAFPTHPEFAKMGKDFQSNLLFLFLVMSYALMVQV